MLHHQRFDLRGIDVVPAAQDDVLLAAGDAQIALVIHPANVAGHEPAGGVEGGFGDVLIVEITEHEARAAPADLAILSGAQFDVDILLIEDPDLVAIAGAARCVADGLGVIIGQGVVMGARFRHAKTALGHDAMGQKARRDAWRHGCA